MLVVHRTEEVQRKSLTIFFLFFSSEVARIRLFIYLEVEKVDKGKGSQIDYFYYYQLIGEGNEDLKITKVTQF